MSFFDWERRPRRPLGDITQRPPIALGSLAKWLIIPAVLLLLFILGSIGKGIYTEWLWFGSLGFSSVYATILKAKVVLFFIGALLFCALFVGNLLLVRRFSPRFEPTLAPWAEAELVHKTANIGGWVGAAFFSLIFGLVTMGKWETVLRFQNATSFGNTDPIFGKEIAFYVFSIPFYRLIQGWLLGALIVTLLATLGLYLVNFGVLQRFGLSRQAKGHLYALGAALLLIIAWSYWLDIYGLVHTQTGVVFGASYTDVHARLLALRLLIAVAIVCASLLVANIFFRGFRFLLFGIGLWIVVAIVVGAIYPALVQRFQVKPSELTREKPYIEYEIAYTREAFALDRIDEQPFLAETTLSEEDILKNPKTIDNVRLWDHRPLKDTYNQIQAIRLYYDFYDVDVDRYTLDGEYRQVMLAARELSPEKLAVEAQTWVNRRLQFTHGYGVALSPVNKFTTEGLPVLLIKDIPPTGDVEIERPEVYYGERTNEYVIVNTNTPEFDYPRGEENVYGQYAGEGGVSLGSFLRRLAYAWQFGDINILISGELNPESRVLYYRNIQERVQHLAPFLVLDDDPYLAIQDGGLVWIQDAYTVTDKYPYSQPSESKLLQGQNYIRNSVKAVINAYDGSVTLYIADPEDALIQTYASIFPVLFTPLEEMPPSLKAHLRYPEGLFLAQAEKYQTYHMQDARVFYNKEDLWNFPTERYRGSEQVMEPYYVIMRLPGETEEEFLLMLPFTPAAKKNTIGWLAARSDGEYYGRLLSYHFPKEKLVYGPMQVENLISQEEDITEQFALWNRGGANVIQGNLLMIPIENSYLYVEPVFLQATEGGLPVLIQVIAASGDNIAMRPTLEESLKAIFEGLPPALVTPTPTPTLPPPTEEPVPGEVAALVQSIQKHLADMKAYAGQGDWESYGKELQALEADVQRLTELTAEQE